MDLLLKDRATAGRQLANRLTMYRRRRNVFVLAVAPGGIPVAAEIAKSLEAPLDVIVVRTVATPGDGGVVFGAIATGGARALDWTVVSNMDVSEEMIDVVCTEEESEIERRMKLYRGNRLLPEVSNQCVILVDEGVDTGTTMHAAIAAVRALQPAGLILAVPVGRFDVLRQFNGEADEVICLGTPYPFETIGRWYWDFPAVTDDTIRETLAARWIADDACTRQELARKEGSPDRSEASERLRHAHVLSGGLS